MDITRWLEKFDIYCIKRHIERGVNEVLRAHIAIHNPAFITYVSRPWLFDNLREKLLKIFGTDPPDEETENWMRSLSRIKEIVREAIRIETLARPDRSLEEDLPEMERIPSNRGNETYMVHFHPRMNISAWFDNLERFMKNSKVVSSVEKARLLYDYTKNSLPDFLAALPLTVTSDYEPFKIILMERYMPLLRAYTYCGPYNGVSDLGEWLDRLDWHATVLDCFDISERAALLRNKVDHLPCTVHITDLRDHGQVYDKLNAYYGTNPFNVPMVEPFKDGLPRYNNHLNMTIRPYDGIVNVEDWVLHFEIKMIQEWCDNNEDRFLWFSHYVRHLDYPNKQPSLLTRNYRQAKAALLAAYSKQNLSTVILRETPQTPPPAGTAGEIVVDSTESTIYGTNEMLQSPDYTGVPSPTSPISSPDYSRVRMPTSPSSERPLLSPLRRRNKTPTKESSTIRFRQTIPFPELTLTTSRSQAHYSSCMTGPTSPANQLSTAQSIAAGFRPVFPINYQLNDSQPDRISRNQEPEYFHSNFPELFPREVKVRNSFPLPLSQQLRDNQDHSLQKSGSEELSQPIEVDLRSAHHLRSASFQSTSSEPMPETEMIETEKEESNLETQVSGGDDSPLQRMLQSIADSQTPYQQSTVELIDTSSSVQITPSEPKSAKLLPKLANTKWYKIRASQGVPPDSWLPIPEIPDGWKISPVAALKGLITIIPLDAPNDICLTPEYMKDKPVPDGAIHHQTDIFPCVLLEDWTKWTSRKQYSYYNIGTFRTVPIRYPNQEEATRISQARNRLPSRIRVSIPYPPPIDQQQTTVEDELPLEEPNLYMICPPLPEHQVIDLYFAALGGVTIIPEGQPRIVRNSLSLMREKSIPIGWTLKHRNAESSIDPLLADITVFITPEIDYWLKDSLILQLSLVTGRALTYNSTVQASAIINPEFPYVKPKITDDRTGIDSLTLIPRPITVTREDFNPLTEQPGMSPWTWPNNMHTASGQIHIASMLATWELPPEGWLHHWGPPPDNLYSLVPDDYDYYKRSQAGFLHKLEFMRYNLPPDCHWHNHPRPLASRVLPNRPFLQHRDGVECPFPGHDNFPYYPDDDSNKPFGFGSKSPSLPLVCSNNITSQTSDVKKSSVTQVKVRECIKPDPSTTIKPQEHTEMVDTTPAEFSEN